MPLLFAATDITIVNDFINVEPAKLGAGPAIGDADCSWNVDVQNLLLLKACFGSDNGADEYRVSCDFDGNEAVDVLDFLILKQNFGLGGNSVTPSLCVSE